MRAAVYAGPGRVLVEDVPDPVLVETTDAIVRVEAAGVCGSDLWTYRGQGTAVPGARIGHECVGTVEAVGEQVTSVRPGDWVVVPFRYSDGACVHCRAGLPSSCLHGGFWSREVVGGCQAEYLRVPWADGTLVRALPDGARPAATLVPHLLALTDVMGTGYHAAVSARVGPGSTVVVVGDGAVGLCAVLAAQLLGAERVLVLASSHPERHELAEQFGADEVIAVRGPEAVAKIHALTEGLGAASVLECVGTADAFATALSVARAGGAIGYVGLPHGVQVDLAGVFARNLTIAGGLAPARRYLPDLLPSVVDGTIGPGAVFTARCGLEDIPEAYRLMDSRETVKPLLDAAGPAR